jgi:hypothetical protein
LEDFAVLARVVWGLLVVLERVGMRAPGGGGIARGNVRAARTQI